MSSLLLLALGPDTLDISLESAANTRIFICGLINVWLMSQLRVYSHTEVFHRFGGHNVTVVYFETHGRGKAPLPCDVCTTISVLLVVNFRP